MSIRRFALAALASALIAGPVLAADTLLNVSWLQPAGLLLPRPACLPA
ncbi:hypothetical protein [Acinetobacter baumannii]|nr:hypothetical protein [Acinetobacter baumannii]